MPSSTSRPAHVQETIDRTVELCLACCSSLPPSKAYTSIFTTPCCNRPICPACVASNSRLTRYNPCIACLGGVRAVASRNRFGNEATKEPISDNIAGAVRHEDTYVIGEDEEDVEDADASQSTYSPPPPYESPIDTSAMTNTLAGATTSVGQFNHNPQKEVLPKYYIQRGDSLQGLAFRFGVSARELCKLNNLPPSTCSTTPHLLHTRTFLVMPASASNKVDSNELDEHAEVAAAQRDHRRERERAAKRLQMLTKEVDWCVAKAYIAMADDPEETLRLTSKRKESGRPSIDSSSLEDVALSQYFDDDEWEASERRAGRCPSVAPMPARFFSNRL